MRTGEEQEGTAKEWSLNAKKSKSRTYLGRGRPGRGDEKLGEEAGGTVQLRRRRETKNLNPGFWGGFGAREGAGVVAKICGP